MEMDSSIFFICTGMQKIFQKSSYVWFRYIYKTKYSKIYKLTKRMERSNANIEKNSIFIVKKNSEKSITVGRTINLYQ